MHPVLARQLRRLGVGEAPPDEEQWRALLSRIEGAYEAADQDRYTLERALEISSEEMRGRMAELRKAQGDLVEASRRAGMADLATSVLHNVGNVLNSVNVSANVAAEIVRSDTRKGLGKSLTLLRAQSAPGRFLDEDPKGRKLLQYLEVVDRNLDDEQRALCRELEALGRHVDHVKAIVAQQLAAARGRDQAKLLEPVVLPDLLDDALGILGRTGAATMIQIVREYVPCVVTTDRHKLLQILVNLLTNARDAVAHKAEARIGVRLRTEGPNAIVEVVDDGAGIPADRLAGLFVQGFSTKERGHGIGLHSSACAAMELGGTLSASSEGVGHGATFTLVLPRGGPSSPPGPAREAP